MDRLSHGDVRLIGEAAVLLAAYGDQLSSFEQDTIVEVCQRFREFKREAVVTAAEWLVVGEAVRAMRRALEAADRASGFKGFLAQEAERLAAMGAA